MFGPGFGYYDFDGNPVGLFEWAHLFEDFPSRLIARTEIGDTAVSTVWIGIDLSAPHDGGTPMIYETAIQPDYDYCMKYPTRVAALAGHDQAVQYVKSRDYARERADTFTRETYGGCTNVGGTQSQGEQD